MRFLKIFQQLQSLKHLQAILQAIIDFRAFFECTKKQQKICITFHNAADNAMWYLWVALFEFVEWIPVTQERIRLLRRANHILWRHFPTLEVADNVFIRALRLDSDSTVAVSL